MTLRRDEIPQKGYKVLLDHAGHEVLIEGYKKFDHVLLTCTRCREVLFVLDNPEAEWEVVNVGD